MSAVLLCAGAVLKRAMHNVNHTRNPLFHSVHNLILLDMMETLLVVTLPS